jgi:hypothetical protein
VILREKKRCRWHRLRRLRLRLLRDQNQYDHRFRSLGATPRRRRRLGDFIRGFLSSLRATWEEEEEEKQIDIDFEALRGRRRRRRNKVDDYEKKRGVCFSRPRTNDVVEWLLPPVRLKITRRKTTTRRRIKKKK